MSVKDNSYGIAELQNKMLDILKCFINICENRELKYWLAGGSCLGAIRHQGFIPWDDDLDVYMPRDDYEKLWVLYENQIVDDHFKLCRTSAQKNYHHRVMQMVDLNTTFVHSRNKDEDLEHGVYIDIIPIDACPDHVLQRGNQFFNAVLFSICNIQCKPEYNGGKMTRLMNIGTTSLLKLIRSPESRYRVWTAAEKRMSKYNWHTVSSVKCITSQFHELTTAFPKEWFGFRKERFEDIEVCVPKEAERYLEKMYGDYMSLPPEEQRVARHNIEFMDLDNSYTAYKGIYYCVNQETHL